MDLLTKIDAAMLEVSANETLSPETKKTVEQGMFFFRTCVAAIKKIFVSGLPSLFKTGTDNENGG